MEIAWQPPKTAGHPPFHKYKLQRTSDPDGLSEWRSVNRQVDVEATSWVDRKLQVLLCTILPRTLAAGVMSGQHNCPIIYFST